MTKIVVCPNCKFRFDVSYGRAFACGGCSSAAIESCAMSKCPKCGTEFPI